MSPEEPRTFTTKSGRVLTEADLDDFADRVADPDYDPPMRVRTGRPLLGNAPAQVLTVRLDPELRHAVDNRADADQMTTSEVIRRALRSYLEVA